MNFSMITTCKGRLDHLKQTLLLMVQAKPDEIIVVDFDCPDGTRHWIHDNYPTVQVVEIDEAPFFNGAYARNLGAKAASHEWLCFVDADVKVKPDWIDWLRGAVVKNTFYTQAREDSYQPLPDAPGTCVCNKTDFEKITGYDTIFTTWGGVDLDLYDRLLNAGVRQDEYPEYFVSSIQHDDERRVRFYAEKNRPKAYIMSRYYRDVKRMVLGTMQCKTELGYNQRALIMRAVHKAFENWPHDIKPIKLSLNANYHLNRQLEMLKNIQISVTVKPT